MRCPCATPEHLGHPGVTPAPSITPRAHPSVTLDPKLPILSSRPPPSRAAARSGVRRDPTIDFLRRLQQHGEDWRARHAVPVEARLPGVSNTLEFRVLARQRCRPESIVGIGRGKSLDVISRCLQLPFSTQDSDSSRRAAHCCTIDRPTLSSGPQFRSALVLKQNMSHYVLIVVVGRCSF